MTAYIIKIILCSAVFIFTYKLLFEKEKMLLFNRCYLLSSLALSFIIPCISFNESKSFIPISNSSILGSDIFLPNEISKISSPENASDFFPVIILVIYIIISTILLFRFVLNLGRILSKTRSQQLIPYKHSHIVLINEHLTPHSFLNYLFLNKGEYYKGNIDQDILIHEYTHIHQRHSYDILFIEISQIFYWFNPFLILYRKAIQLNHEFLADEAVLQDSADISIYQYLLIEKANKNQPYHLASQFNYSLTKKRLVMMTKTTSLKQSVCKQMLMIPIIALSLFAFSTRSFTQDTTVVPVMKPNQAPPTIQEGVSQEMLDEYDRIVNSCKNEKGMPVPNKFTELDKKRLQTIYLAMSSEQRAKQIVVFRPSAPPMQKTIPTQEQLESWKDSKTFGVWINNKRVNNTLLNKYKHTDFAYVFVSKLGKNTVNYGKHYYQVDLMTINSYEEYYKEAISRKDEYHMGIRYSKK